MNSNQQSPDKATTQTITDVKWWTDSTLTFTTTKPENYSFAAGQYARLGLGDIADAAGGPVWRAYSMTSAPQQEELEFYGILVPNGLFTTRLKKIRSGDHILVEKQSYGFMTPDRFTDGEDLWMLATGTGIGPYISILRDSYVWKTFRNLVVVHGVRHPNEFAYQDQLAALAASPPVPASARLQVVRAVSRETATTAMSPPLQGRITSLLEDGSLERAAGLHLSQAASRVMMCGNPAMIEDMRRLLHQRNMRPCRRASAGQFVAENYW